MSAPTDPPSSRGLGPVDVLRGADFELVARATGDDTAGLRDGEVGEASPGEAPSETLGSLRRRLLSWGERMAPRVAAGGADFAVVPLRHAGGGLGEAGVAFALVRTAAARRAVEKVAGAESSGAPSPGDVPFGDVREARLTLRVTPREVVVALELPAGTLDARNLRARVADPERSLQLLAALEGLPEEFVVAVGAAPSPRQARSLSTDELRAVVDEAAGSPADLWLGWSVARATAEAYEEILAEQLEDALVALADVYRLVAWAPDNDALRVLPRGAVARSARREADTVPRLRTTSKRASRGPTGSKRPPPETWDGEGELDARRDGEQTPPSEPRAPSESKAPGTGASSVAPPLPRPALRAFPRRGAPPAVDLQAPVEKGTQVRVLEGPFAGKAGVVQELDGKGTARVLLGLLALWLPRSQIAAVPAGRERRLLMSSHRKPLTAR